MDSNARSRNSLGFSDSFDSVRAEDRKYKQHIQKNTKVEKLTLANLKEHEKKFKID